MLNNFRGEFGLLYEAIVLLRHENLLSTAFLEQSLALREDSSNGLPRWEIGEKKIGVKTHSNGLFLFVAARVNKQKTVVEGT